MEKIPKKRGRKPKSNITINNNPIFDTEKKIDNLIICLKQKKETTQNTEELPGYSGEIYEIDQEDMMEEYDKNELICWNCCYGFSKQKIKYLPIKYDKGVFHTFGSFCSYECGGRYLFDNYNSSELWDKMSLLNIYYNITMGTQRKLNIAPPNLLLKRFGGKLTIEEYREESSYQNYNIKIPPIIPIHHTYHKHDAKIKNNDNIKDYSLYRKTPLKNKNNIFKTMNIQS